MKELAIRITARIKLDMINRRKITIGKAMMFNDIGELNGFVNYKVITKEEFKSIYTEG